MRLPEEIEHKILELIGMPDLNWKSIRVHNKKLNRIRNQMYKLADDFAESSPSEIKYSDAYFAYNFPLNLMKVRAVVLQLKYLYPQVFEHLNELRICDIGCGEGAGMLGIYYGLQEFETPKFTGFDTSPHILRKCKHMMQWLKTVDERVQIRLQQQDMSHGLLKKKVAKYDIVILANSLTEMFTDEAIPVNFIERLLKSCAANGVIIVLEPATKNLSRRLMTLRDDIISRQKGQVLLPCLHSENCPLIDIRKQKDWCHQSISWQPPDYLKILNQGLNREIKRLKFSYLVIAQKKFPKPDTNTFLVISDLLKEKGKKRCFLCTPTGRVELVRFNKLKCPTNSEFDKILKGNIISFKNVVQSKPQYWQIAENTKVKISYVAKIID
ncbi:MAG: small ribosomal subunit Rsm22 family protein [bacterium]